jgi:hypothetical protein
MTLSHLLKFANRITLSELRNQEGRIFYASYRASHIAKIGINKQQHQVSHSQNTIIFIILMLFISYEA